MSAAPNKPDAVNPAIAPRFQVVRQPRGVTDPCRWSVMRRVMIHLLFGITLTALVIGCATQRTARSISYGMLHEMFGGFIDLPFWTDAFREDKHRLPRDYAELSQYVTRQAGSGVQLPNFARVDFTLLPSGQRQAECNSVTDDSTNRSSITWGKPKQ